MVAKRVDAGENNRKPRRPPATTTEGREMQLASMAYDLAEKQILDGTVSAQVLTHFLKAVSSRNKLEEEKLRRDNLLSQARVEQISSSSQNIELYEDVLKAMKIYTGEAPEDLYDGE